MKRRSRDRRIWWDDILVAKYRGYCVVVWVNRTDAFVLELTTA
jgi:hypothetical protein